MILWLILFLIIYFYATRNHDYWRKRNVKHDSPLPFFGNHLSNTIGLKNITEISVELYKKYPHDKVVGYYRGTTPELIVRDLEIAKRILSVDFAYFYPRGLGRNTDYEPLLKNLFHADGDSWKLLRKRLTPAFTIAKLKGMFPLVVQCTEKMQDVGEKAVADGGECDVHELMARFTTDFIGACGFGIEMDTINNEHSAFRKLGKTIFSRSLISFVIIALWELFPELRKVFHMIVPESEVMKDITIILQNIQKQRQGKASGRNDFVDLLLELKAKGVIHGDSIEKVNPDGTPIQVQMEMDVECMAAQMFIFFAAGFETSSSATSYTLHELAFHPDIQSEIQEEIDQVMIKYDNKMCFDSIAEMSLLNMAFKEGLRKFPPVGTLHRVCAKQYNIPELDITIDPGVKIIIPIKAIQVDAKYYDNPAEFRPERFAENAKGQHKFAFLPFGTGPRSCIGERLGEMQSLAGLAAVLHKFSVEPAPSTRRQPLVNQTYNTVQVVKGGLPLKLKSRKPKVL